MKIISLTVGLLLSTSLFADNVKLRFSAVDEPLKTDGVEIEQIQAKLRCHFVRQSDGGNLIRRRYPFTQYRQGKLLVKKSSLTEWLPGFDLKSCAYVLIVIGKDERGSSMMGDIVLLGKFRGDMSRGDLRGMQNRAMADALLKKRLAGATLVPGYDHRGKYRIILK